MPGIFDAFFDLDGDGQLDEAERFIRDAELYSILEDEEAEDEEIPCEDEDEDADIWDDLTDDDPF